MLIRLRVLLPFMLLVLWLGAPVLTFAQETSLADQVRGLVHQAEEGQEAAEQNKPALMRAEYAEIHAIWTSLEDRVRAQDPDGYIEIEQAMDAIKTSIDAQPLNPAAVGVAYKRFNDIVQSVANQLASASTTSRSAAPTGTSADLLQLVDATQEAIKRGDVSDASTQLAAAMRMWPAVEVAIGATSQEAYTTIETNFGRASAALQAQPANLAEAADAVEQLRDTLAPFAAEQTYTVFDAAAIILREGLEALLVVVALLAFLQRSGNQDKRGWIWAGTALGVLASIVTAVLLQQVFSHVSAGQNREVIEGVTGLVAAALLFYVSYWLHSKANMHAWRAFIDTRTTQAIARGSMFGLALLAFLAVFREGAETTVFYLGMAPAIALRDLLLGLGIGTLILIVAAALILIAGVRLPLRPFFRIAGLLIYYLGFKFVGTGIHALQVANAVPTSPITGMPAVPILGIYPTWETTLCQIALLAGAVLAAFYLRAQDRRMRARVQAAQTTTV